MPFERVHKLCQEFFFRTIPNCFNELTKIDIKTIYIHKSPFAFTSQRTPVFEVKGALPLRGSDEQTWKAPQYIN